jgi:hypothetical protein
MQGLSCWQYEWRLASSIGWRLPAAVALCLLEIGAEVANALVLEHWVEGALGFGQGLFAFFGLQILALACRHCCLYLGSQAAEHLRRALLEGYLQTALGTNSPHALKGTLGTDLSCLERRFYFVPALLAMPLTTALCLCWAVARLGPAGSLAILAPLLFIPLTLLFHSLKSTFAARLHRARADRIARTRTVHEHAQLISLYSLQDCYLALFASARAREMGWSILDKILSALEKISNESLPFLGCLLACFLARLYDY